MDDDTLERTVDKLAREIGLLFISFGLLDHLINLALAAALELSVKQERALLRGMQSRSKIDLLDAFAKRHFDVNSYENLKVLTKEAREIADFRNDIAHGLLAYDKDGNQQIVTFRGQNRFDGKEIPLSATIVGEFSSRAASVAGKFQGLLNAIESAKGRPRTPPPLGHPPK